jgi:hypothetical protein
MKHCATTTRVQDQARAVPTKNDVPMVLASTRTRAVVQKNAVQIIIHVSPVVLVAGMKNVVPMGSVYQRVRAVHPKKCVATVLVF